MEKHYQLTDETFARQFEMASLEPSLFTHEAHLRLAFILIKRHGIDSATKKLCQQIAHFDQTFGDGNKYHMTVTVAAAKIVHHFMLRSAANSFPDLLQEFPRLKANFKDLLLSHYDPNIFQDPRAKSVYIKPNLLSFDT